MKGQKEKQKGHACEKLKKGTCEKVKEGGGVILGFITVGFDLDLIEFFFLLFFIFPFFLSLNVYTYICMYEITSRVSHMLEE